MVSHSVVLLSLAALIGVTLAAGSYGVPKHDDIEDIPVDHEPVPHNPDGFKLEGKWSSWSSWSKCSKTCDGGSQSRSRVCQKPKYLKYVHNRVVPFRCSGSSSETKACNTQGCPGKL
ncbi:hypothetical protein EB796_017382 [Bugula neritina]|uniref:Uncharacterized protein n=1 Tax=Bugula neritina TaxID=10212 RepID=A0A7J7JFB4_BUGNE|nr:hypothetical protein EB796_017382 [Bugula neritina]